MGVLLRGCRAHTFLTKSYSTSLVSHPILNLKCELVFFFSFPDRRDYISRGSESYLHENYIYTSRGMTRICPPLAEANLCLSRKKKIDAKIFKNTKLIFCPKPKKNGEKLKA